MELELSEPDFPLAVAGGPALLSPLRVVPQPEQGEQGQGAPQGGRRTPREQARAAAGVA